MVTEASGLDSASACVMSAYSFQGISCLEKNESLSFFQKASLKTIFLCQYGKILPLSKYTDRCCNFNRKNERKLAPILQYKIGSNKKIVKEMEWLKMNIIEVCYRNTIFKVRFPETQRSFVKIRLIPFAL